MDLTNSSHFKPQIRTKTKPNRGCPAGPMGQWKGQSRPGTPWPEALCAVLAGGEAGRWRGRADPQLAHPDGAGALTGVAQGRAHAARDE